MRFVLISITDGTLPEIDQGETTVEKKKKPGNTLVMELKDFLDRNGSHMVNCS